MPFPVLRTGAQAGSVLVARLFGAAASFAALLVLAQGLGQAEVGVVLTALAAAVLGEVAATLGRDAVAVQAVPQALAAGDRARASAFAWSLWRQVAWGAPLAGAAAGLATWLLAQGAASARAAALTAVVVIAMTSLRALARLVMAAGGVGLGAASMFAVRPALWLGTLAWLRAADALSVESALGAAAGAALVAALLQALLGARHLGFVRARSSAFDPDWGRSGYQLILPSLMIGELPNLVTLCASVLLAGPQVAVLGVALRVAGLVALGARSLIAALGPRMSAAWSASGPEEAERVGRAVPVLAAPATLAVAGLVWLLAAPILDVFGEGYREGAWTLRVLVLMPLVTACAGPSLSALTAAGRAKAAGRAAWPAAFALAGLSLAGALLGTLGVAVGVVAATLLWETLLIVRLRAAGMSLWLPFGPRAR